MARRRTGSRSKSDQGHETISHSLPGPNLQPLPAHLVSSSPQPMRANKQQSLQHAAVDVAVEDSGDDINISRGGLECSACGCRHLPVYYTRRRRGFISRVRFCRNCGKRKITHERDV